MTNDIKDIYDYHTGSDYLSVDTLISSSIGDYSALELDAVKINNAVEESYFIYQGKRLYWISLIIPEDKMNLYYNECKEILNTLKITD